MFSPRRPVRTPLRLERLEGRDVPAALTPAEAFNQTLVGDLPAGWVQWANAGSTPFAVSPDHPYSGPGGLAITGNSRITARAWVDQPAAADSGTSATVLVNGLEPVEVIARGHDLGGTRPSYYAVTVARGLDMQLVRVVEGQATVLAHLRSADYVSGKWLRVTLRPQGDQLSAEVYDPTTDTYLNADGEWQS